MILRYLSSKHGGTVRPKPGAGARGWGAATRFLNIRSTLWISHPRVLRIWLPKRVSAGALRWRAVRSCALSPQRWHDTDVGTAWAAYLLRAARVRIPHCCCHASCYSRLQKFLLPWCELRCLQTGVWRTELVLRLALTQGGDGQPGWRRARACPAPSFTVVNPAPRAGAPTATSSSPVS